MKPMKLKVIIIGAICFSLAGLMFLLFGNSEPTISSDNGDVSSIPDIGTSTDAPPLSKLQSQPHQINRVETEL